MRSGSACLWWASLLVAWFCLFLGPSAFGSIPQIQSVQGTVKELAKEAAFRGCTKPIKVFFFIPDPTSCPACASEVVAGWLRSPQWLKDSVGLFQVAPRGVAGLSALSGLQLLPLEDSSFNKIIATEIVSFGDSAVRISHLGNPDGFNADFRFVDSLLARRSIAVASLRPLPRIPLLVHSLREVYPVAVDTAGHFQVLSTVAGKVFLYDSASVLLSQYPAHDSLVGDSVFYQLGDILFENPSSAISCWAVHSHPFDTVFYNSEVKDFRTISITVLRDALSGSTMLFRRAELYPARLLRDPDRLDTWIVGLKDPSHVDSLRVISATGKLRTYGRFEGPPTQLYISVADGHCVFIDSSGHIESLQVGSAHRVIPLSDRSHLQGPVALFAMKNRGFVVATVDSAGFEIVGYNAAGTRSTRVYTVPPLSILYSDSKSIYRISPMPGGYLRREEVLGFDGL